LSNVLYEKKKCGELGKENMLIRVIYFNDKYDMVNPNLFDELMASKKIKKFLRREGWTTIGVDPIRGMGGSYRGPERRKALNYPVEV
jgi:hypothetical protein